MTADEKDAPRGAGWAAWAEGSHALWVLIAAVTALRLAYLAWGCPYTLIEDEAHYWEWSRRPDWSYYSKGPGVAWTIWLGTLAAGHTELGVRLMAPIFAAVAAWAVATLATACFGSRRVGFAAALALLLAPIYQTTALLMTIDGPYAACWLLALVAAWRAMSPGAGIKPWLALGAAVGVGLLFKYTILLLVPGLGLYAWLRRRELPRGAGRGAGLALLAAGAGLLPIAIWNAQRDWPTVRHLMGHLGLKGGDMPATADAGAGAAYSPAWTLEFIASQLALVGPALALAWLGWRWARRGGEPERRAAAFLVAAAAPILLFYIGVSFVAEPEGNWAMAGYLSLLPLAGVAVVRGMDDVVSRVAAWRARPEPRPREGWLRRRPETPAQILWHATLFVGILAQLAMLRLDWLATLPGIGPKIPLSRLIGADRMASHVDRLRAELWASTGREPIVVSQFYGRASQMAFYLPDRPVVFCSGTRSGGRRTQYDYWPQTDLSRADLAGRPAVLLGDQSTDWSWGFRGVKLVGKLDGDRKRNRVAFVADSYAPLSSPAPEPAP